ncbi:hypothetical protein VHEMI06614 [[Torrubiella] hemipterigena]|uniref:C2H2-type domain-containing protein n=1 Tax=[Torrubiella] hemipterigena TaxID=1531966 RepID=A0A0A1TJI7_9HYPO|nr:hypothetical protein VHEMI06614 [[Torrubiella] hemipterigena]
MAHESTIPLLEGDGSPAKIEPDIELPVAPNALLLDIHTLASSCGDMLNRLCSQYDEDSVSAREARKQLTSFNIWVASVGVFREGHHSLAARLKNTPEISNHTEQLLTSLKDVLDTQLSLDEKDNTDDSDSDKSSDRSSTSYRLGEEPDTSDMPPATGLWISIHSKITSLRQLAIRLHRAGTTHRKARVDRFIQLERNQEIYGMWTRLAYTMASHAFPKASTELHERIAVSIARRRAKLMYLESHRIKKTATIIKAGDTSKKPAPLQLTENKFSKSSLRIPTMVVPSPRSTAARTTAQTAVISQTTATKYQAPKRAESVLSTKVSTDGLPVVPKFSDDQAWFDCPFCCTTCPSTELSTAAQWQRHLIHDLEPFFCVFGSCTEPFTDGESYSAWLDHIQKSHSTPQWYCWYCQSATVPLQTFSSSDALEEHLRDMHNDKTTDSVRSVIVNHSMLTQPPPLHDCPFCGGYPEEIEKAFPDRQGYDAVEALAKHMRDHLIEVALMMLPTDYDAKDQDENNDIKSEADRGDVEYQNVDGLEVLDKRVRAGDLKCGRIDCDCLVEPIPYFLDFDWSQFSQTFTIAGDNMSAPINFDDPTFTIWQIGLPGEWQFLDVHYGRQLWLNVSGVYDDDPANDPVLRMLFGSKLLEAAANRKVRYMCRDPAEAGIQSSLQPEVPLSACIFCKRGKMYSEHYGAAAHLRRVHFNPRSTRGRRENLGGTELHRDGRDGVNWPPTADLANIWFREVLVPIVEPSEGFAISSAAYGTSPISSDEDISTTHIDKAEGESLRKGDTSPDSMIHFFPTDERVNAQSSRLPPRPSSRDEFRIAIFCALSMERAAVKAVFDYIWDDSGTLYGKLPGDENIYTTGFIAGYNAILVYPSAIGVSNTSRMAASCRRSFPSIQIAVVVGICAVVPGLAENERLLGDIIVSETILLPNMKRPTDDGTVQQRPLWRYEPTLARFKTSELNTQVATRIGFILRGLQEQLDLKAHYPGTEYDMLFEPGFKHLNEAKSCTEAGCNGALINRQRLSLYRRDTSAIAHNLLVPDFYQNGPILRSPSQTALQQATPVVHIGSIASTNVAMRSAERRDALSSKEGIIAFEVGMSDIFNIFTGFMIKSAADYADGHQDKSWQQYASATAAAGLKAILEEWVPRADMP